MGLPQARPLMVWLTTAWKIEAARSSFVAPSLIRGWISDLAKTPQRAAIVYRDLYPRAYLLSPAASVCRRLAIWSMNEPVPPAQIPFILCSMLPFSKYMILASSPPSSIATSVFGAVFSRAVETETTSWTKGTCRCVARVRPPDPVMTG